VVRAVEVLPPSSTVEENALVVRVEYELIATRDAQLVEVRVV